MKKSSPSKKTAAKKVSKAKFKPSKKPNNVMGVIFMAVFAIIAASVALFVSAGTKNQPAAVTLSVQPSSQRVQVGETVALAVKLNTNGEVVNAVQADLSYPADKFEFVSIDTANSAFTLDALANGGSGTITIVKGAPTTVNSSEAHVATVYLKAIASGRKVNVNFQDSSAVIRASDTTDILTQTPGGTYTVQ